MHERKKRMLLACIGNRQGARSAYTSCSHPVARIKGGEQMDQEECNDCQLGEEA